jgi:hypothetical protein
VPEEHLHVERAHAALDQPGCEGVTESVTGELPVPLELGSVAKSVRIAQELGVKPSARALALTSDRLYRRRG